jgi:hypothetical protein
LNRYGFVFQNVFKLFGRISFGDDQSGSNKNERIRNLCEKIVDATRKIYKSRMQFKCTGIYIKQIFSHLRVAHVFGYAFQGMHSKVAM